MTFIWPWMLALVLFIPVLVGLYARLERRRRRFAASFSNPELAETLPGRDAGLRRHVPPGLFLTGVTLMVISLARPQAPVRLPQVEGTVILAFDVSGSMAAPDLRPTRMEAAKAAARLFVQQQPPGVEIGVVAFSDSGFSVQAPTDDQAAVLAAINRLSPQRGTSLARGILVSLGAIVGLAEEQTPLRLSDQQSEPEAAPTPIPLGTYSHAAIVLLTDGENNELPDPISAALTAADFGVRIYPVGIGSPVGATLNIDGFSIHTRLNEEMLQRIAAVSDGAYYNAGSEDDLRVIYANLEPHLVVERSEMEITSLLAGASIVVLLLGGVFSLLWFNRLP